MHPNLTTELSRCRVADPREKGDRSLTVAVRLRRRRQIHELKAAPGDVTIRLARAGADAGALERLAALDSSAPLEGAILLAEVDGQLRAALATRTLDRLADPFHPTADLVALLSLRARQLRAPGDRGFAMRRLLRRRQLVGVPRAADHGAVLN